MSDIQLAAERLRAWIANPIQCKTGSEFGDCFELAKAYLDEHLADDGLPITNTWVALNFPSMGEAYSARQRSDLPCLVWQNRFERFTLYDNPLPHIKTRGQLRQLCRALGAEIKEKTE